MEAHDQRETERETSTNREGKCGLFFVVGGNLHLEIRPLKLIVFTDLNGTESGP